MESLCVPVVVPTRPQGGGDPVLPLPRCRGRNHQVVIVSGRESKVAESDVSRDICLEQDLLPVVEPLAVPVVTLTRSLVEGPLVVARPMDVIFPGRESTVEMSDVNRGICMESDFLPVVMSTVDVELLAISVVAQTRPRVGRGPDLALLVAEGRESLPAYGLDVILSGQESTVGMSDVSRGICMEPDLLPVVMSTDDKEALAVPVVALTRSRVEGPLVVARPLNVDAISRAAVYPDMLSRGVRTSVDPDVRSGDPMSLKTIPDADGDARHSVWREMVLDFRKCVWLVQ